MPHHGRHPLEADEAQRRRQRLGQPARHRRQPEQARIGQHARQQAAQQAHSVLAEVLFLAAHGTLHLLGYDDATSRQRAAMFRKQEHALPKTSR